MKAFAFFFFVFVGASIAADCPKTVLFLPLDERFTTRDAFLNLAEITPFCILTPPTSLLPSHKTPVDLPSLYQWVDSNVVNSDVMIVSSEMFLYGGLIQSRISNDTTDDVTNRLKKLLSYKSIYPNLSVYLSAVVMRIPAYNGDFEEPWYWEDYGLDLYDYSYYQDKYNQEGDPADLATAQAAEALVPDNAVNEFLWRRQRNYNITVMMLNYQSTMQPPPCEFIYITQDDNAEFGFNIREAQQLKDLVANLSLKNVPIYPGADEVQLTMLSRFSTSYTGKQVRVGIVYRDPATISYIPNYEGQPMNETLLEQLAAAGGVQTEDNPDLFLLVNNFSTQPQEEAPNQPNNGSINDYAMFTSFVNSSKVIGFADNRYSNGADNIFVDYIDNQHQIGNINMSRFAYAGWNTDGNTLGCVISNAILLQLFQDGYDNTHFVALRILEDKYYQAIVRTGLENYVNQITDTNESTSNLQPDLDFYVRYAYKVLESHYTEITTLYDLPWKLESVYFPWNRTFEIGLEP